MMSVTMSTHGGLSNRIKNLLSAMSKHENINTTSHIDSYIFPFLTKVTSEINQYPPNWRLEVLAEEEKYIKNYKTIDLLYEKTPQYFIDKYLHQIKKLKINSEIINIVDQFSLNWDNMIGVHIRTWPGVDRSKWHSNSLFEKEIEKLPKNMKIFLCSDSSEVISYFKTKYQDRIITYNQKLHKVPSSSWNDNVNFNDFQLVVDGFIDNLLLSKCSIIIGTWGSTFSEIAWWFGKCKSKVVIPKPLNLDQNFVDLVFIKGEN
tara:strand:- start:236 stop:1018 length:783 start_codon:yes stop_codon:yes gene_type:complete